MRKNNLMERFNLQPLTLIYYLISPVVFGYNFSVSKLFLANQLRVEYVLVSTLC